MVDLPAGRQGGSQIKMVKYNVYAIKSKKDGRIYVGMSINPELRLKQHNQGKNPSTKPWRPWKTIYKKLVGSRVEARKEEKRLKSGSGKEFLKSLS